MSETVQVFDASHAREIPLVEGVGSAKVVIWPGMGANFRTLQIITLGEHAKTVPLRHPGSDAAYYVIKGQGKVFDTETGESQELIEGGMVHIDANDGYQFIASSSGMRILGGPCPADASLYVDLMS
jgi:quercetin dioxygenase-like cupin family protein